MREPTRPAAAPQLPVPACLAELLRWIRWRLCANEQGKMTKVPDCSTRDASRWRALAEVLADGPVDSEHGVGLVFTNGITRADGARLFAFDLDGCRDPVTGAVEPWAREFALRHENSYTEITPSGCGLRVWVWARAYPPTFTRAKVNVPHPAAPNVPPGKSVNVQVFGYGAAQYVTVTGRHLPGTSADIATVADLRWAIGAYGLAGGVQPGDAVPALPAGTGAPPSREVVAERLRKACGPLFAGDWKPTLGASERDRSASAAYYRLVQHALRAANGHGRRALEVLLGSPWGAGLIDDSADPSKYGRAAWVATEVARVAGKAPVPSAAAFADDFDASAWRPTNEGPPMGNDGQSPSSPNDLLGTAAELLGETRRDRCLVFGVLPRCGLAQFYGKPGSGKTPFVLSLAVHVAGGKPKWFGHDIDRHGAVVYMIGEDRAGIRDRLQAEVARHGLDLATLPFYYTKRPGSLTDPGDVDAWLGAIRAVCKEPVVLLVVDTLSRNFGPANENATEDMAAFVAHTQKLADALDACVTSVHHPGHGASDRGRGSSVMYGALDSSYEVTRESTKVVVAVATKSKNWADPPPLRGSLVVCDVGVDSKGRPITAVALDDTPPAPAAAVFEELDGDDPVRRLVAFVAERNGRPTSQADVGKALGLGRGRALDAVLTRASELGLVEVRSTGRGSRKTTYHLTETGVTFVKSSAVTLARKAAQVAEIDICELLD